MSWFIGLDGWVQALLATLFTWGMTALGAAVVFVCKKVTGAAFCLMLSGAAGIMLASSFFSLLLPALKLGGEYGYITLSLGFVCGGLMIALCDLIIGTTSHFKKRNSSIGERSNAVMTMAVTMHNIPEGLAVGVAFGALHGNVEGVVAAAMLTLGVGIQNFPEGMCVSFPLRASGEARLKSFFIGQLSGFAEVLAGVSGALAVGIADGVLPFALAFSSGAMVAVICSELIPQSFSADKLKATIGAISGFTLMMILDLAFG